MGQLPTLPGLILNPQRVCLLKEEDEKKKVFAQAGFILLAALTNQDMAGLVVNGGDKIGDWTGRQPAKYQELDIRQKIKGCPPPLTALFSSLVFYRDALFERP